MRVRAEFFRFFIAQRSFVIVARLSRRRRRPLPIISKINVAYDLHNDLYLAACILSK